MPFFPGPIHVVEMFPADDPTVIPSVKAIDGEPVWAQIMSQSVDMGFVLVTQRASDWTIWFVWADDSTPVEFHQVVQYAKGNDYKAALARAAEAAMDDYPEDITRAGL
jgi:hypothetical protein